MKRAFITGIAGQDGSYMADLLRAKGYEVFGFDRADGDLSDGAFVRKQIRASNPDEIYNFAGVTDLKTAFADPEATLRINYESVVALLDEALEVNPKVRFLQASSSETLLPSSSALDEASPRDWDTKNPYAQAKLLVDRDVVQASRARGVFACSAILFNHESSRRSVDKSVMHKITSGLVNIKLGLETQLIIGNPERQRDWGFAGDYVQAMWHMLQLEAPEDFVLASGSLHRVQDIIDIAGRILELDVHKPGLVEISQEFYRPAEAQPKFGDTSKAERVMGWKPTTSFERLIESMVRADLELCAS